MGYLEVAHCLDIACSSATTATVGAPDHFAFDDVSSTIGTDGLGLIGFIDPKGLLPRSLTARTSDCSQSSVTEVDSGNFR